MKDILMKRLNVKEKPAEKLEMSLNAINPKLRPMLDAWLKDESYRSTEIIEGYSIDSLMKGYNLKFTAAILTLDWLMRDPVEAKKAIAHGIR